MVTIDRAWCVTFYDLPRDCWGMLVRFGVEGEKGVFSLCYLCPWEEENSFFCNLLIGSQYKTISGLKRGVAKRMRNFRKACTLTA